ncbi:MAG: class I SAM-dependent methyltransferase [Candidatus Cloacimonetes bacterium]|nr:class I SAM-dependent methyltransferase [Candidatus Cloacimonadota bacterium]
MDITLQEWENEYGINFLKKVGIKKNFVVLDFGARVGHYSLPAAKLVNPKGKIFALDKNHEALDELKDKAKTNTLSNMKIIKTDGEIKLDFPNSFFDTILLYDVLHYFDIEQLKKLFSEMYRLLKPQALLSLYPKHIEKEDYTLPQIIEVLKKHNFTKKEKVCDHISHYNSINYDCVYNFYAERIKTGKDN